MMISGTGTAEVGVTGNVFNIQAKSIVNIKTKDINKTKITGSKSQAEYDSYLDKIDEFNVKIREQYSMYNTAMET